MKLFVFAAFAKYVLLFPAFFHSAPSSNMLVFEGSVIEAAYKTPLTGATLIIKGTTKGTATNDQGHFALEFRTASAVELTLVVSYTGYVNKEIKINTGRLTGQTIALEEDKNGPVEETIIIPAPKKTIAKKEEVIRIPGTLSGRLK